VILVFTIISASIVFAPFPPYHNVEDCTVCHDVRQTNPTNFYYISDLISTPNSGNRSTVFTSRTGSNSFADGDGTYDGVCEICHTSTLYFNNNGGGEEHLASSDCIGCHEHRNEFSGTHEGDAQIGNCQTCHWEQDGSIMGTSHDLSGQYAMGTVCDICHLTGTVSNHELTVAVFDLYSSLTLDASDVGQPGTSSNLCLSCHDGTVAIDSFGGNTGWDYIGGAANIGTDLSTVHPISFTYDTDLATTDGKLWDPLTWPSGLVGTIDEDMLFAGKMECASCHDTHNEYGNSPFLKKTTMGSELCYT
jgi:hypothetical protein